MKTANLFTVMNILALVITITTHLHAEPSVVIITGCLAGKLVTETYAAAKDTVKRDEFWNDSYLMWELFYKNYHWPEKKAGDDYDGIHFLYGWGGDFKSTSPRYQPAAQTDGTVPSITDYPAYRQDVTNIFNWLAIGDSGQGIPAMTNVDPLFVYTSDHGSIEGDHSTLRVMDTDDNGIIDTTFARMVNQIPYDRRVFWMQQCFSGGFIDDLQNAKTIIHTACKKDESAWIADNKTLNSPFPEIEVYNGATYRHNEFSFHLINSLRGTSIFGTSYADPWPVDADSNMDGKVSIYESWLYERDHESTLDTPQFSDMGNLASNTFLDYPIRIIDTVKNQFIDLDNINNYGTVFIDTIDLISPSIMNWSKYDNNHLVSATDLFNYNNVTHYFCSWSDGLAKKHTIATTENRSYTAFYKKRPSLGGTYDGWTIKFNWDWPLTSRPPYFKRFELYQGGVGKIWEGTANSKYLGILLPNKTFFGLCAVMQSGLDELRIYSNDISFYASPIGDPIVAYSNTTEATSYSNGRKIVVDSNGKLHVVFATKDTVYYTTSSDDGITWSTETAVGEGRNPAIELNTSQAPSVCWSKANELYYAEHSSNVWGAPQLIYTGPAGSEVSYLSYVLDQKTNNSYLGWVDEGATASAVYISPYNPGGAGQLVPTPIDQGGADLFKSPSLALDRGGNLKAAWSNNGVINYFDETGQIELGQNGIHPIVDAYGDRTTVVWQEEIAPGVYQIAKRNKGPLGWGEKQVISYPDEKNADFPVVAANGQYVYSKNTTGNDYDVFWHGEYENGWTQYERNITYASGGISKYPSVAFRQVWPKSKLYILWTEDTLKTKSKYAVRLPVKIYTQPVEPVPYFYADLGTEEAMAYTLQKEGTLCYGQTPDLTVDYHPSQLKYSFTGLDPARYYMLKAVYYHESSDRIQQKMKVAGQQFDVANLKPKEKAEFKRWLMPNLYSDGQIDITIDKQKGEYAVCAVLSIEEYEKDCDETKGGGAQTTESKPVSAIYRYELMQNAPNPSQQSTMINYQLAKPEQVSLKVYNTLGQVVKTLVNESQNPGPHSVKWDNRDETGREVTAGIYFYRLASGEFSSTKKMVVLK
jgi:hypothetical protein